MREPDLTRGTTLYVPNADSHLRRMIHPGSGIVGTPYDTTAGGIYRPDGEPSSEIDYEGAVYGQANMATYEERVYHAWDRHVTRYPTVARMVVPTDQLIEVGFLIPMPGDRPQIVIDRQDVVDEWCAATVTT